MDVPTVYKLLQFNELRKVFYGDLWRKTSQNIGAEFHKWQFGYSRISRDGMTTVVEKSSVMLDDHLTLDIMGNKVLTYSLFSEKGFHVPDFCSYTMRSFSKAKTFLERHGGPLVVKPTSGSGGGLGVTTGITSIKALKRASRLASRFDTDLLVEEQLAGDSYRLLYLDGRFIDAVRRDPPTITGDGQHTIRQLIRLENVRRLKQRPISALSPLRVDRDCINKLQSMGLTPGSRLEKGRTIVVKQAVNENCASRNHSVKDQVHPEIIALGSRLVKDLGVRVAGLDLLCNDITMPLSESNGIFNEVNTTPGIHHHYLVSDSAKRVPVAELVLEHMFINRKGVMVLGRDSGLPRQHS